MVPYVHYQEEIYMTVIRSGKEARGNWSFSLVCSQVVIILHGLIHAICLAEAGVGDWMESFPEVRFMINTTEGSSVWKTFGFVGLFFIVKGLSMARTCSGDSGSQPKRIEERIVNISVFSIMN